MSTQTTNYGLVKPDSTDLYDIAVQNSNMDKIDTALKNKANTTDVNTALSSKANTTDVNTALSSKADKSEVDSLKKSVSDGKTTVANAITGQGVTTATDATFATMATNIGTVATNKYNAGVSATKKGTATAAQVLTGYTFTNSSSVGASGTMTNNGAVTKTLSCGGSYTIPKGYHDGSGKVTANDLASQTSADAVAADITSGKTAYVNGKKITGTNTGQGDNRTAATIYVDSYNAQIQFWFRCISTGIKTVMGLGKVVNKNIYVFVYYRYSDGSSVLPGSTKAAISLNGGTSWINITNDESVWVTYSGSTTVNGGHVDVEIFNSSPYYSYFASGDKFMCMTAACEF